VLSNVLFVSWSVYYFASIAIADNLIQFYPPNINRSRCCDQAICTECFVQIKRSEPTTTHLVSEPAACPYCVQENFGIIYTPPPWRAGVGNEVSRHFIVSTTLSLSLFLARTIVRVTIPIPNRTSNFGSQTTAKELQRGQPRSCPNRSVSLHFASFAFSPTSCVRSHSS